jgi:hypothetical protein
MDEDPEIPLWYARASLGAVGGDTLASTVILQRAAEVRSE